jgi:hypothetical protein
MGLDPGPADLDHQFNPRSLEWAVRTAMHRRAVTYRRATPPFAHRDGTPLAELARVDRRLIWAVLFAERSCGATRSRLNGTGVLRASLELAFDEFNLRYRSEESY